MTSRNVGVSRRLRVMANMANGGVRASVPPELAQVNEVNGHRAASRRFGCALLMSLALLTRFLGVAPAAGEEPFEPGWYMVIDRAGILDSQQEQSAVNDAWRLTMVARIPTQVVTENLNLDQAQADERARELRQSHGIETTAGADDGLLVYAAVDPHNRESIVMSISVGANTLPRGGLDAESIRGVQDGEMAFQLSEGRPARAIVYSLREIAYLELYVPPADTGPTGWKARLQSILLVLAPLLAALAAGAVAWQRAAQAPRVRWVPILAAGVLAGLLAIAAVPAQSTLGIAAAGVAGTAALWAAIDLDRADRKAPARRLVATPRPPRGPRERPRSRIALR